MVAITTKIGQVTKYVTKYYQGSTGAWVFELGQKEEDAHDFKTILAASEAIEKHSNFYNRRYSILKNNKETPKITGAMFGIDKKLC
jgi:hypothetical protein